MTLDALLPLLRCPDCRGPFAFEAVRQPDEVAGVCGILVCTCAAYPVLDGVPVLRQGPLHRRSIADALVIAPGPDVSDLVAAVRAGRALDALTDVLSAPLCPWPLRRFGAGRRLSLWPPLREAGRRVRTHAVRRLLGERHRLTAEDWLAALYLHAPEVYDPFSYFLFRFGTPRHLATLGLVEALPMTDAPVLDLASGVGHLAFGMTAAGRDVVGLDQNLHQAWVAQHYVAPDAAFVCADADRPLPFADAAVGAVLCSDAFHYIVDKDSALSEMERVSAGGPVVLATVGNALVGEPDGHELAPDGYAALFGGWTWRATTESGVAARYLAGLGPDLSESAPDAELVSARWLSYVAARPGRAAHLFCDHGPRDGWPHARGRLVRNPHYERDGDVWRAKMPSPWHAFENAGLTDYLPPVLDRDEGGTPALVARAAFLGVPDLYLRPQGRPMVARADRALTHRLSPLQS